MPRLQWGTDYVKRSAMAELLEGLGSGRPASLWRAPADPVLPRTSIDEAWKNDEQQGARNDGKPQRPPAPTLGPDSDYGPDQYDRVIAREARDSLPLVGGH